jgi:hypothetical protein
MNKSSQRGKETPFLSIPIHHPTRTQTHHVTPTYSTHQTHHAIHIHHAIHTHQTHHAIHTHPAVRSSGSSHPEVSRQERRCAS